jgi:hypothetical protein
MQWQASIFSLCNGLALLSWIYLAIFAYRPMTYKILLGVCVALLCVAYSVLVFRTLQPADFEKFNSLEGAASLMQLPGAALVGWIHYLAFDLMVGLFVAANAARHGIPQWAILPCLLFTFMAGPVGLLLYLLLRWFYTRSYFAENF